MEKVIIQKWANGQWETVLNCASQYNPEKLQVSKSASWSTQKTWKNNVGNTTFTGGNPMSLSLNLFFDTTSNGSDVRRYTDALMSLTLGASSLGLLVR